MAQWRQVSAPAVPILVSPSTIWLLLTTFCVVVALPSRAVEEGSARNGHHLEIHHAQTNTRVPAEILDLEKRSRMLRSRGEHKQALVLQEKVIAWVNVSLAANDPFRARSNFLLGQLLRALGRYDEALPHAIESARIYRTLALRSVFGPKSLFTVYNVSLAKSLRVISRIHKELGRYQDALSYAIESASICRSLTALAPMGTNRVDGGYQGDLFVSLKDLGNRYEDLGRYQEALASTEQSLTIVRVLAKSNPAYQADLGSALLDMGRRYSSLGRYQEALASTEQSLTIVRELAKSNPAHQADLGRALKDLAWRFSLLGRYQEALAPTKQSLAIFRELAKSNPSYQADLGGALYDLGWRYSPLRRYQEALAPTEQSLTIFRVLAKSNPAFQDDLAEALFALGRRYSSLGRYQKALASTEQSLAIFRVLAKSNPATQDRISTILGFHGFLNRRLGRPDLARRSYEDSLSIIQYQLSLAYDNRLQKRLQGIRRSLEEVKRDQLLRNLAARPLSLDFLATDPAAHLKRSVVKLVSSFHDGETETGTGFVVWRQGDRSLIATAAHVVRNEYDYGMATSIQAELFSGRKQPQPSGPLEMMLLNPRFEVILPPAASLPSAGDEPIVLEVRGLPPDIQPLQLSSSPAEGDLTVLGHPQNRGAWSIMPYDLLRVDDSMLILSGSLDYGGSGSPVLNSAGQVVGIAYESDSSIRITKAFTVKSLINQVRK
jgi:tetratricopeptide (TPR) repeat protein